MTTLDTLARSAATAIEDSVVDLRIPAAPSIAAPLAVWTTAKFALAGAAAAVAVLATLFVVVTPTEVADTPTTTVAPTTTITESVPTTLPDLVPGPARVVPVPGDVEDEPVNATVPPDTTPPPLVVLTPSDGEHVQAKLQVFTGTTEPGATVVASGKFSAKVSADGSWSISLVLAPGANGVRFVAADAAGNITEAHITVHLEGADEQPPGEEKPPKDTTTTTKAQGWEFSAVQTYGSCSEPIPYDIFSGTAKPGSTVTITSPYGSGSTTADAEGAWSLRVDFETAPHGEPFEVKARDEFGAKAKFTFVSLYEG